MAASTFVARSGELARLDALARTAADGTPTVVLVVGDGGVGKSALLREHLGATARHTRVLRAGGDEWETDLDFGVADELLGRHERARERDQVPTPSAVGAELLRLLTDDAEHPERPTALVLDDVHWIDQPSLRAVSFAARRLRPGDRCLVVLAVRPEALGEVPEALRKLASEADPGGLITLTGLGPAELGAMVVARGRRLPPAAVERLHAATRGSPLHAGALLDELDDAQLASAGPLPAPAAFHTLVLARVAACAPSTRDVLAAGSVLGDGFRLDHVVAVAGTAVDDPAAALDEAVAAGLLRQRPGDPVVRFGHPLVHAAIYHDLAPGRRADLHRRAADVVDTGLASMRHALAGVIGTDDTLADMASKWADDVRGWGGHAAAGAVKLGAARITGVPAIRHRRQLEAVVELVAASQYAAAVAEFDQLPPADPSALEENVRGVLAFLAGDHGTSAQHYREAYRLAEVEGDDADLAMAARNLAATHIVRNRFDDAVAVLTPALPMATVTPNLANDALASLAHVGRVVEGLALAEAHPDWFTTGALAHRGRGVLRFVAGDLDGAVADLTDSEATTRRDGPAHRWHEDLNYLGMAQFWRGDGDGALSHAGLAVSLADEPGSAVIGACANATAAGVLLARGQAATAATYLERTAAVDASVPGTVVAPTLDCVRALGAWCAGDPAAAVAALERLVDPSWAGTWVVPWRGILAWALAGVGRLDEADSLADHLLASAATVGPAAAHLGHRARAQARLARRDRDGAVEAYEEAAATAAPTRLDAAVTELELGTALDGSGRRRDAERRLRAAHDRLVAFGATPFAERARQVLDGYAGVAPAPPAVVATVAGAGELLSPAEHAVARLVRAGASNREVADTLVLSVRTVETHLAHIYRKLGIRSRTQLVARLGAVSDDAQR